MPTATKSAADASFATGVSAGGEARVCTAEAASVVVGIFQILPQTAQIGKSLTNLMAIRRRAPLQGGRTSVISVMERDRLMI